MNADRGSAAARAASTHETALIDELRELTGELHGVTDVRLDSDLEIDLGLYSLERVELALRLEQRLGIRIAPAQLATAETVADILRAIDGQPSLVAASSARRAKPPHARAEQPPSFGFTIRVALILLFGVPVTWLLLRIVASGTATRRLLQRAARLVVLAAGGDITVSGLEHLRSGEPVIVMANHQSFLDSFLLIAALPLDLTIVANEKLPRVPLLGPAIVASEHVIVNRRAADPTSSVDAMVAILREGHPLLVFPEGTIRRTARKPLRLGGFAAAIESRCPIVPVTITGTRRMFPPGRWTLTRTPLSIAVHPAIHPEGTSWNELMRLRREAGRWIAPA